MRSLRLLLAALAVFCFHSVALADDLENFFRKCLLSDVSPQMFHDQGRYIVSVGNQTIAMNKTELLRLYHSVKATGAKSEILSLKLGSRIETGNMISVVVTAKMRQTVGSSRTEGEIVSHEVLVKENGRYVSVFSLGRQ